MKKYKKILIQSVVIKSSFLNEDVDTDDPTEKFDHLADINKNVWKTYSNI